MAEETHLYKTVRLSGSLHVILGVFILVIGIVDRVKMADESSNFPAKIAISLWTGIWVIVVGVFGVLITLRADPSKPDGLRPREVKAYLIAVVVTIALVAILVTCYSVSIALIVQNEKSCNHCPASNTNCTNTEQSREHRCTLQLTLGSVIVYEGVLEIIAAVWTLFKCRLREQPQAQQPKKKERYVQEAKPNAKGKQPQKSPRKRDENAKKQPQNRRRFSEEASKDAEKEKPMTLLQLSLTNRAENLPDAKL